MMRHELMLLLSGIALTPSGSVIISAADSSSFFTIKKKFSFSTTFTSGSKGIKSMHFLSKRFNTEFTTW